MKSLRCTLFLLLLLGSAGAKEIMYELDTHEYKGYLATPSGKGPFPAVLIVHEWWGLNDYARMRADQLAKLGYVALAMDMYGLGQTASTPAAAQALASESLKDWKLAYKRVERALAVLKKQSDVDPKRVAAIGYCYGGGVLLNAARSGLPVQGVVSFHGSLKPQTEERKYQTEILVLNGAADPMVSTDEIESFKSEMKKHGVEYEFINYEGALHAFSNPSATKVGQEFKLPVAYDQKADLASWKKMKQFFKKVGL